jgi:hypothetical protein
VNEPPVAPILLPFAFCLSVFRLAFCLASPGPARNNAKGRKVENSTVGASETPEVAAHRRVVGQYDVAMVLRRHLAR